MLLDQLLGATSQLLALPGLDQLPDSDLTRRLKQYLVSCKVDNKSKKTIAVYSRFVGYFIKFLLGAGIPANLPDITHNHVRIYIVSLQERLLTPETVNAYFRALHTFFNWMEGEEYITKEKNPFNNKNLHAPTVPSKHVRSYPAEVLQDILTLCGASTTFTSLRNYAIVLIFLDTGIRKEELATIKLADLYIDQGLIRVMGKGRKERIVKMGDKTQKALLQYLLRRNDSLDSLWVTDDGKPLGEWGIVSAIRRIAERAAVPEGMKHGTHVYRHTGATNYLRNKGSVKCLQEMLGHVHIETTMKYVDALGPAALIADHIHASPVDNLLGGKR